jgi:hypothetical protein
MRAPSAQGIQDAGSSLPVGWQRDGTVALPLDISVERGRIGLDHLGIVGRVVGLRHAERHRGARARRLRRRQRQRLDGVESLGDSPVAVDDVHDLAREVPRPAAAPRPTWP